MNIVVFPEPIHFPKESGKQWAKLWLLTEKPSITELGKTFNSNFWAKVEVEIIKLLSEL